MMNRWMQAVGVALVFALGAGGQTPAMAQTVAGVSTNELNIYRANNRRKKLTYSKTLERAAVQHAKDMTQNGFKSHTGSDGSSVGDRLKRLGYKWCHVAENITWGRRSYAEALAAWDASPGHKKNMLGRKAREYGVGRTSDGLWVMVFARRC